MNCRTKHKRETGLTIIEVLVAVVCAVILLLLFLPVLPNEKGKSPRVRCTANLKQVTLGYLLWSHDNGPGLPMETAISKGGIRERALAGDLLATVRIAANELRTPSILICPADKKRKPAQTFASLTTANISYILNIEAAIINQTHILAGDRNLDVHGSQAKPGLLQLTNVGDVQWANWLHAGGGNVALVDGSAHQVTAKGLRDLLAQGGATNRLIIP